MEPPDVRTSTALQSEADLSQTIASMSDAPRFVVLAICALLIAITPTACHISREEGGASVLLFNGTGTSPGDVAALERILEREHFNYVTVNSPELNGMHEWQIRQYRLLILPGGNFEQIGRGLKSSTTANIRNAIRNGLNYLGICAGAFFAGNSPYNGLNLTSGSRFDFYAAERQGIRKAAVPITAAGEKVFDQYWEDGPQLNGWGAVVAKYPDRTAATAEGAFGKGWVILTGIHAEAPESWRGGMDFRTPVNVDTAYAARLIRAALNRESLPHY